MSDQASGACPRDRPDRAADRTAARRGRDPARRPRKTRPARPFSSYGRGTGQVRPGDPPAPANEAAAAFFRQHLAGSWVPAYLARRGFDAAALRRWQAGYAPGKWDALARHLRGLGYDDVSIEAAGLAHRSWRGTLIDTFRDRAVLPIRSADGAVVAFIGRAPDGAAAGVPKYLNTPRTARYVKAEVLFGLHESRHLLARGARPVIVEGPFDAMAVTAASAATGTGSDTGAGSGTETGAGSGTETGAGSGTETGAGSGTETGAGSGSGTCLFAGVSPCGTAFTAGQAAALGRAADLPASGVLVAFDPDQAGLRAAVKAYHLLSPLTDVVLAAVLPAGTDPAQILATRGPAALHATLARCSRPLADLVIDAETSRWTRWLGYPEGQISALRAAAPVVARMPPAHVARQVARLAHRLSLDYATVTDAVTDALTGAALSTPRPGSDRPRPAASGRS